MHNKMGFKGDATLFLVPFAAVESARMLRVARTVFAGLRHHVTQRGNRRENVFFMDEDRRAYLIGLKE